MHSSHAPDPTPTPSRPGAYSSACVGEPLNEAEAHALALELFVAGYEGTTLPPAIGRALASGLAGVILFRRNLAFSQGGTIDIEALAAHTRSVHEAAAPFGMPPICSVDQEGGTVARLREPFTLFPPMREIGDRGDLALARAVGLQLGRECIAAGFNVDFAPVLDVDTNPQNPIIGKRSFSRHPAVVAEMAGALLDGLQAAGVLGCGKHFPGHGDTDADSHLELPVLPHDLDRLRAVELVPFRALAGRMHMVMTAHVLFPALDPRWPATLSPAILGPLLREECGFQGVIVSDDLEMHGVARLLDPSALVHAGLAAGVDMFLVCRREDVLEEAVQAAATILAASPGDPLRRRALESIGRVRALRGRLARPLTDANAVAVLLADARTANLRLALETGTLGSTAA